MAGTRARGRTDATPVPAHGAADAALVAGCRREGGTPAAGLAAGLVAGLIAGLVAGLVVVLLAGPALVTAIALTVGPELLLRSGLAAGCARAGVEALHVIYLTWSR